MRSRSSTWQHYSSKDSQWTYSAPDHSSPLSLGNHSIPSAVPKRGRPHGSVISWSHVPRVHRWKSLSATQTHWNLLCQGNTRFKKCSTALPIGIVLRARSTLCCIHDYPLFPTARICTKATPVSVPHSLSCYRLQPSQDPQMLCQRRAYHQYGIRSGWAGCWLHPTGGGFTLGATYAAIILPPAPKIICRIYNNSGRDLN